MRPLSRFFLCFYSWRCCHRLANCQWTIEAFVVFGGRRKAYFSICPLFDRGRQPGLSGGCLVVSRYRLVRQRPNELRLLDLGAVKYAFILPLPGSSWTGLPARLLISAPRGCTGVANQRSCCLEEERIVWQATAQAGERSRPYALRHRAGLWPGVASCLVDASTVGQVD